PLPSYFHRASSTHQLDKALRASENGEVPVASAESSIDQIFAKYKSKPTEDQSPEEVVEALVQINQFFNSFHFHRGKVILNQPKTLELNRKNREDFIRHIHSNPVVSEMMGMVSQNLRNLSDHHLASCLLFAKALKFSIRDKFSQQLLEEMTRRKGTLSTLALRTLVIALRHEYIYGCLVAVEFLPLYYSKILNLSSASSNEEIRFVSSILRTIIAVLFELQFIGFTVENKQGCMNKTIIVQELLRKYCLRLEPKVSQLDETHLPSLSKFLEFQQDPVSFIHAVLNRANQLWAENYTRVDIMCIVRPKPHDTQDNATYLKYFNTFLDNYHDLKPVVQVAYRALKKLQFDEKTYDKYWSRVNQLLLQTNSSVDASEDDSKYRFCDLEDSSLFMEANLTQWVLKYANEYLNLLSRQNLSYSHSQYEQTTRDLILKILEDYKEGRALLLPSDYAKATAFLLAVNHNEIKIYSNFLKCCGVEDLILINKGAEIGRNNSFILANLLSMQSANLFRTGLTPMESILLTRVNTSIKNCADFSPMFKTCLENVVQSPLWNDSRVGKEILTSMLTTGFYFPPGLERVAKIIVAYDDEVSIMCVEKFLWATFVFGCEYSEAVATAAKITEKYFDYIHPFRTIEIALALCYHRALSQDLVQRMFGVEFIDILDEQIRRVLQNHHGIRDPNRVRDVFMSLNRAVCLDVPEANVPWFHQKYCEEIASVCKQHNVYQIVPCQLLI
ncbi:unnamed protein product, partial [Allacma fusca]